MILTRSYKLQVLPSESKLEEVKYSANRYGLYLQVFVNRLFFQRDVRFYSTLGLGLLANQAQREAIGIIANERAVVKATGNKSNVPQMAYKSVPGLLEKSTSSSFDYWIRVQSQFNKPIRIPAKSHWKLNEKLRQGWRISKGCKVQEFDGTWYAVVYVKKDVESPKPQAKVLGVDVGIANGVSRSDGYQSKSLLPVIKAEKRSQAERQRQKHPKKPSKTLVKQLLDAEVTKVLRRSQALGMSLAVENPKVLANLRHRVVRWARSYFANRLAVRALEEGVWVENVNPAYTSITCNHCGHKDKRSRAKTVFSCTACRKTVNADVNAAKNIARKGQERLSHRVVADKVPVNTPRRV